MAVGQYQLILKGEGPKLRLLLLNTANGHVHVANPQVENPEWKPLINNSPPTIPLKYKVGEADT